LTGDQLRTVGPLESAAVARTGAWNPNPPKRSSKPEAAASAGPLPTGADHQSAASPSRKIFFQTELTGCSGFSCRSQYLTLRAVSAEFFWRRVREVYLLYPLSFDLYPVGYELSGMNFFAFHPQGHINRALLASSHHMFNRDFQGNATTPNVLISYLYASSERSERA
jgi:hypothetical protein